MPDAVEIRRATLEDLDAVAALAARTFKDTFAEANDPADMAAYLERWFAPARIRAELEDPASTFLLAFAAAGDAPIGYVKLRAGAPEASVRGADPIEVERLYVGREAIGRGVGSALMQACLDEAARAGRRTLWLGVWERNGRAIAFYRRWGFVEVGSHDFMLGSDRQTDLIMERPVALPSA